MSSATNTQALTQTGVVVDGRTAGCDCTCDRDRHLFCSGPKRMLALDGGVTRLRARFGWPTFIPPNLIQLSNRSKRFCPSI